MKQVALLILTLLAVTCLSTGAEVTGVARPPSPAELETGKARLRLIRSEMSPNQVLDTLGLTRFRDCGKKVEGPTTLAIPFDLGGDQTLDLYYQRPSTNSSAWELYWIYLDEAGWFPAQNRREDAAYSRADVRKQGETITSVTAEELASARDRLRLIRPDMTINQVITTLRLSRFRGHFLVGSGSMSFSPHCDLGSGHKLDMIYNHKWTGPPGLGRPSGWTLSWIGLDWQENQTGLGQWRAPDKDKK